MVCSRNHSTFNKPKFMGPTISRDDCTSSNRKLSIFREKTRSIRKDDFGCIIFQYTGYCNKIPLKERERSLRTSVVYSSKQKCRSLFSCLPLLLDCWVARKRNVICGECGHSFIGERGAVKETVFHGILLATQCTGTT